MIYVPCLIDRSLHRYSLFLNTGQQSVQVTNISVAIDQSVNSAALIISHEREAKHPDIWDTL